MTINAFLVISDGGALRVVKSRPYLNNNEIAVALNIDVPDAFFERMIPVVQVDLPEEAVAQPDADVSLSITAGAVAKALKLDVSNVHDGLKDMVEEARSKK